ncbi:hypothetical protein QFZ26_001443 [Agromyces ramosus]|uniref:DUF2617 family protein n=2 Tax=Agromyces ramosus TaxID=33879 RepID=A0ABU0R749_9MICO|nr:hypothetical protein [Agromyces ramosus]
MTQNGAMSDAPDLSDPHVLGPGLLPTPFTADEIRAGCPDGRLIRLLVEPGQGEPFERVNRFAEGDESGAVIEHWRVGADGGVEGEIERERSTWLELQEHAAFPSDRTTRSRETLELPIGRVDCLRYDTRLGPGAESPVATFWFALGHAGMPVRFDVPTPDGVVSTKMVADVRG